MTDAAAVAEAASGALAGLLSRLVVAPMDVLKIRLQVGQIFHLLPKPSRPLSFPARAAARRSPAPVCRRRGSPRFKFKLGRKKQRNSFNDSATACAEIRRAVDGHAADRAGGGRAGACSRSA